MADRGPGERNLDAGIRLILEELRDMRVEMRDMRVEMRDMRVEMRADRRRADEERRQAAGERRQFAEVQRRANKRFEEIVREFREDSSRREAATQRAFKDIRTVGFSIVKTLNLHTRILERIDKKLGARPNGLSGQGNGRGDSPR